jgi:hypothetical protein
MKPEKVARNRAVCNRAHGAAAFSRLGRTPQMFEPSRLGARRSHGRDAIATFPSIEPQGLTFVSTRKFMGWFR